MPVSPMIEITYCRLCGWGLRAGWMAQELAFGPTVAVTGPGRRRAVPAGKSRRALFRESHQAPPAVAQRGSASKALRSRGRNADATTCSI